MRKTPQMDNKDFLNTFGAMRIAPLIDAQINDNQAGTLNTGLVTANISNTFMIGNFTDVSQLMQPGLTSIPNPQDMACMLNLFAGQSNPYIIGYNRISKPSIVTISQAGESTLHSNYYAVNVKNEALLVNYSKANPQVCQLPIGEGYVVVSLDFIAQLEALVTAHNALVNVVNDVVSKYNAHQHSGVQGGGDTSAVPTNTTSGGSTININPDITTDKNYLQSGKALISETGENVPH